MAAKLPRPVVFDFETESIEAWPLYPPRPVGVSILLPGERKPKYYAFGHPAENNCTEADAKRALGAAYAKGLAGDGLLCHNAKFDLDCAETHWGLKVPSWEFVHDTMFLVFLDEPHSTTLALKPASERLLGLPPEEQDALRDWLVANKVIAGNVKNWGGLICKIPGGLVGKYANGDVTRTKQIFDLLYPRVVSRGMGAAYNRERQLLPILLKNEHQGVPVDFELMLADDILYQQASVDVDVWLRKQLKVSKDFNIDSDAELAEALISTKKADKDLFLLTPTGKLSTAKASLIGAITDTKMLNALQYRTRLNTAHGTFLHPWAVEAAQNNGVVHPSWNQVRQAYGTDTAGARTGRLSASRFMNLPKVFEEKEGGYQHPTHIKNLPPLPFMRKYMVPFKGEVWCKRDYAAQELRVLAHFGDGVLMGEFNKNPKLDVHQFAADMITERLGRKVSRKDTKTIGFGLLYGLGLGGLAERLGVDVNTAKIIKNAYFAIFPEVKDIQDLLKEYENTNQPLTTWGGRQYYCEEPRWSDKHNRMQSFGYKMLNYVIQSSSADISKQAIINYDKVKQHGRLLVFVHDELNLSVPKKYVKTEMKLLRDAMMDINTDVRMESDGSIGNNWGALQKFED